MFATPEYNLKDFPNVYVPCDDTFLFLEALEIEFDHIKSLKPLNIIEIGSGSGLVINFIANALGNTCNYYSTDINYEACCATQSTSLLNHTNIECLNMNLLSFFRKEMFDIILFNPPYVETEPHEMRGYGLNRSWAGGKNGRVIIDKFLKTLNDNLRKDGICYMIAIEENKPHEIKTLMKKIGFITSKVTERRILGEHLYVLKFTRE